MESQPPIPPPFDPVCPHCGSQVADKNVRLCPNCGATLSATSRGPSALQILGAMFLALIALGFGSAGGCFMLFSGFSLGSSDSVTLLLIGGGLVALAVLCIWGIVKLLKKKQ